MISKATDLVDMSPNIEMALASRIKQKGCKAELTCPGTGVDHAHQQGTQKLLASKTHQANVLA